MIVDDDAVSRALLRQIISQAPGVDIVEAEDGLDAWNQLNSGVDADLCLLDIMMPQMDGIQFLRRLRQDDRFKRLKVIICSVVKDGASIKCALSLNVDNYILKPFTKESVRQVFQSTIQDGNPPAKQPASGGREQGRVPVISDELLGFIESANDELVKLRQWLKEDNRLAAWESVGALLKQARKLNLRRFAHTLESLEAAIMAGKIAAAFVALDAAALGVQTLLSHTIGKPVSSEPQDQTPENVFSI